MLFEIDQLVNSVPIISAVETAVKETEKQIEMTALGWGFMGISWLVVTVLLVYCFKRIIFEKQEEDSA